MPKIYAARRLLELGPLTVPQFVEITGWGYSCAVKVLARLREAGEARLIERGFYEVTA
jgi:hypothetical protein